MKKSKKKKRYQLGGLQQFQQPQQQSAVDSQSEQQANALVSGVGAINPIVGAAMKVGQGVGAQTMDSNGIYNSRAGGFLDNNINPTTGITNFKDLSSDFSASTLANQLSAGLVGRSATQTRRKKELALKQIKDKNVTNLDLIGNSGGFKHGGNLPSKLKVVSGGTLNQISPDAVEVNATNPGLTDSVELDNAFVDNNEVIDNQDRVFSDVLTTPNGKSIASSAKRLEKMKSQSSRFSDSNTFIDNKLNDLFNYQESIKASQVRTQFTGNKNNRVFDDDPFVDMVEGADAKKHLQDLFGGDMKKKTLAKYRYDDLAGKQGLSKGGVKPKPVYDKGGKVPRGGPRYSGDYTTADTKFGDSSLLYDESIDSSGYERDNFFNTTLKNADWGKIGNTAATVAPNIVNAFLQRKLKGPAAPSLENELKLGRVDPSAQLAENARQASMTNKLITSNTAQGANLSSSLGSVLAKRLAANNQIYGQNQAINTQIQNQEAVLNQGIRARNAERQTGFRNNQVDFKNRKLMMTSENVANLSNKIQSQNRERKQMDLDRDRFNIIQSRFEDLPDEMKARYPSVFDYYNSKKEKNKLGGKLSKKLYRAGGKMKSC